MTVLVAVDREEDARRVLEEGERLAKQFDENLVVTHVLTRKEFVNLERTSVSATDEVVDPDEVRDIAAELADELAEAVLDDYTPVGAVGDPAGEVLTLARKHDASYVVIGIRKRSAVGKAVFGSTAQDILMSTDRSVVVVPREKRAE
jgi:nucleotide-binding universal stress UspA family protein